MPNTAVPATAEGMPNGIEALERKAREELTFGSDVWHAIMSAQENAHTTIHEEKAAPAEDYDRLAMATLAGILSDNQFSAEVTDWFKANGVRW